MRLEAAPRENRAIETTFQGTFPAAGLYKIWLEFRHADKDHRRAVYSARARIKKQNQGKIIKKVFGEFIGGRVAFSFLLLRLFAGSALMMHGWGKIQAPFNWMDKMPNHPPAILQALAALSEFGGGLALILGLLTPLACLGIACTMGCCHFNGT